VSSTAVLDRDRDRYTTPSEQRLVAPLPLSFTIDADHQANQPPEANGGGR
jgi:hypothetical protein